MAEASTAFARQLEAKEAEMAMREAEFSRDQDEMFSTISKLEEEAEQLRTSHGSALAADLLSDPQRAEKQGLESRLAATAAECEAREKELMRCQEELAVCKAELLDLRLSLEESSLPSGGIEGLTEPASPAASSATDAVKRTFSSFGKPFAKKPK
eukprot:scaffold21812_cov110-Isochrysis_galbana.AAC.26